MAGLTIADATHAHRRGWFAPAILATAHFLFSAWFDPFRIPVYFWTFMFCAGVFYIQPVLFATWAAIGPPPAVKRILLSMGAYAAVLIGSASLHTYLHGSPDNFSMMVMMPVLFAVTFIALVIVGKFTRWRIDVASSAQVDDSTSGQFSLKFLMVFTAICRRTVGHRPRTFLDGGKRRFRFCAILYDDRSRADALVPGIHPPADCIVTATIEARLDRCFNPVCDLHRPGCRRHIKIRTRCRFRNDWLRANGPARRTRRGTFVRAIPPLQWIPAHLPQRDEFCIPAPNP